MSRVFTWVDLFCGGGGTSSGIVRVARGLKLEYRGLAINHSPVAVETMRANHPEVDVRCMEIENAVPSELVPGRKVDFLWASPSCTHHSRAKGGKPREKQLRAQPNLVTTWVQSLFVRRFTVENVPEFLEWGQLDSEGKPIKSEKGNLFKAWVAGLEASRYHVEWRVVTCADYGDATTRQRLFVKGVRKGCGEIVWPEPTHAENPQPDLWGRMPERWRSVRECLDFSDLGRSVFLRDHPLAKNTRERIAVGMKQFAGIDCDEVLGVRTRGSAARVAVPAPFIVRLNRNCSAESAADPLSCVQAGGQHHMLCSPFIVRANNNCFAESVDLPLSSQQEHTVHHALCQPLLLDHFRGGTVSSAEGPLGSQTTHGRYSVLTPMVLGQQSGAAVRPADGPMPTIATAGAIRAVLPVLEDGRLLDIRIRMLKPSELAAAHSFPPDYVFKGTKTEQIRQIGNSVPVRTAAAMCEADFKALAGWRAE